MLDKIDADWLVRLVEIDLEGRQIAQVHQGAIPMVGSEVGVRQKVCSEDGLGDVRDEDRERDTAVRKMYDNVLLPVASDGRSICRLKTRSGGALRSLGERWGN